MSRPPDARPPVAQMIYDARMTLGLSFRQAAAEATGRFGKMSEGSWRRTESAGDIRRTPQTIAKMAGAVRLTPAHLERAGCGEAARMLERMLAAETTARKRDRRTLTQQEARELGLQLRDLAEQLLGDSEDQDDEGDEGYRRSRRRA